MVAGPLTKASRTNGNDQDSAELGQRGWDRLVRQFEIHTEIHKSEAGFWPRLALLFVSVVFACPIVAVDWPDRRLSAWSKEQKLVATNVSGAVLITTWGIGNWDYFQTRPNANSEGWFAESTKEGGADKLGHFYVNYGLSHGLSQLYEHWGYKRKQAAAYGAWSSFGLMGLMELGDSFSEFGFSYEDMVMNAVGSYAGFLLWTQPKLARKIDFRVEYEPQFDRVDIFTDYENLKYSVALKLDGFDHLRDGPLRYLELQLGYYARGYSQSNPAHRERNVYVGLGLNLSRVLKDMSYRKTARIFNYLQLPGTNAAISNGLND